MSVSLPASLERALRLIEELASEIGPRRPGTAAESAAADLVSRELASAGLHARIEPFQGPSSFAWAQGAPALLALVHPGPLALLAGLLEADLRLEPAARLASRRPSQNVVAQIAGAGEERRTLVLVSHLDTSRSGLLFHPRVSAHLRKLLSLVSLAMAGQALRGRIRVVSRAVLAGGLALLAEREIRGRDVPGANDNASGVAVTAAIACELAEKPLEHTRVILLATGCEESGLAGMRAFLEGRDDWKGWVFVNVDGVGAPATLRYLPREGVTTYHEADPGLLGVCAGISRARPDLGLQRATRLAGLTYDSTQVLARGGRAVTISAQDATIPNYHTSTDTVANIDPGVIARALEVIREISASVDRGDAG